MMNITEKRICDAMLDMMEERSFQTVKVAQLAERCGISRSTFYVYFDSIYSVIQKIEDIFFENLIEEKTHNPAIEESVIMDALSSVRNNIHAFKILTGPNGDPSFVARLSNRNKRVLDVLAEKQKSQATTLELQIVNEFTRGGKLSALQWWAEHENEVSVKDMVQILNKIIISIHGILW